jgi:hypothetical protein
MIKMPKMQKIPNLFLLVSRDDQLKYFQAILDQGQGSETQGPI